ncbi:MAG: F0F1 ATP synthase subunit epsilon [Bacteroidetes bacterium]|nr:F0F1 ATP synthase subunit epsilon [Bacteroidota bacterium]
MADKVLNLEIVTPRRVVFKGKVTSFSAPGAMGAFQVLYNHAPLLSSVKIGEVKIRDANSKEFDYAISGGFVEVRGNQILLLAETAERVDEIDIERAKASRDRARKRMFERKPDIDFERAQSAFYRAVNRLKIAGAN